MSKNFGGYDKNSEIATAKKPFKNKATGGTIPNTYRKESVRDVLELGFHKVPQQNIAKSEAVYFEIRSEIHETTGDVSATYFPYYNKNNEITGFKKRDWTIPKDEHGHFTVVGTVKVSSQLFGQNKCNSGGSRLYICEGEGSVVAAYRALRDFHKKQYGDDTDFHPQIVGLNCGAGNAQEAIAHNESFVRNFKRLILGLDSDCATPKEAAKGVMKGKEATEDVACFLLSDNIFTVDYPDGFVDPRDMLKAGKGYDLGKLLWFESQPYTPEKIVSGDDVTTDELMKPLERGVFINKFPKLMKKLQGFRKKELTVLTSKSGVGKSTFAREVAYEMVTDKEDYRVGFIFLEEPRIKTQQALVALDLGIPLPSLRQNPSEVTTVEKVEESRKKVLANGKTFFLDHFGSIRVDKLMKQIKYLHFICKCDFIFLDHLSIVISGNDSDNERKDLDVLMTELAAFVTAHDVGILAISHIKRIDEKKPTVKKGEPEPEKYWMEIRKEMLRGSASLEQLAFNIIILEGEVLKNGERGLMRSRLDKGREWGLLGLCDTMEMRDDGRLYCVNPNSLDDDAPPKYSNNPSNFDRDVEAVMFAH